MENTEAESVDDMMDARSIDSTHPNAWVLKEDRLSVDLNFTNPFGPRHSKYRSYQVNVPYQSVSRSESWNNMTARISISYRFGKLNAEVKKVRGISNNDVVGGNNR